MSIRTTVDIPEPLHERLRHQAESTGRSVRSLILQALEQSYAGSVDKDAVTGPLVRGTGKLGPRFPKDENPHDVVFS